MYVGRLVGWLVCVGGRKVPMGLISDVSDLGIFFHRNSFRLKCTQTLAYNKEREEKDEK